MGAAGQRHAPAASPQGKTRYLLYKRLGGHHARSGRVRKISPPPPPGFDPWTVQPVASRYTDWAILAHWQQEAQHQNILAHRGFIWCAPTAIHYQKQFTAFWEAKGRILVHTHCYFRRIDCPHHQGAETWGQQVLLKRQYPSVRPQGTRSQKTATFTVTLVITSQSTLRCTTLPRLYFI